MTKSRGNLGRGFLLALTASLTTWIAMFSWRGFTVDAAGFLTPLLVVGVAIAFTGAVARWYRLPAVLVVGLEALVGSLIICQAVTGSPVPLGGNFAELSDRFGRAMDAANTYAPPVPDAGGGVHPLLLVGGFAAMLLVDLAACTLKRVPLAGLPLLTVASVPVSLLESDLSWWVFVPAGLGFLAMLFVQESEAISRWGRSLEDGTVLGETGYDVRTGSLRVNAVVIAALATGLAVLIPTAVPASKLELFDFGRGNGDDADISIDNPMVDLRRDLTRGQDVPVLRVTTKDPDPRYLRISVLNRFSDNEWSPGDRDVPSSNVPNGSMPSLVGVAPSVPRKNYDYEVSTFGNFDSRWLPTQAPIANIKAPGNWRYDASTMDFLTSDDDENAADLDYELRATVLDLKAAELAAASTSTVEVDDELLDLPDDLPQVVVKTAFEVTDKAPTRFQKAVALQQWFREDGGFTYSLLDGPTGSGSDALVAFLDAENGRIGYCEQFAAAMAAMARSINIPARVAVGFLKPDEVGPNEYEYSSHDLHTWPELYFQGAGWVRFEPTPSTRENSVAPSYTSERIDTGDPNGQPTDQTSSAAPRPSSEAPTTAPTEKDDAAAKQGGDEAGFPWLRVLLVLVLLGLSVLTLVVPRSVRRRQRSSRITGGPEDAWDEMRATAVDLGRSWPAGRSPREMGAVIVDWFGDPDGEAVERPARGPELAPEASAALARMVAELEVSRYAQAHVSADGALHDDVVLCVAALEAGVTDRVRRRAHWWPRSVVSRSARVQLRTSVVSEQATAGEVERI